MPLADLARVFAQAAVDIADEGEPVGGTGKGAVGNEKEQIAVRDDDAVMLQQQLADARPFQVVLDARGGEAKAAVVLGHANCVVEVRAALEQPDLMPAQQQYARQEGEERADEQQVHPEGNPEVPLQPVAQLLAEDNKAGN